MQVFQANITFAALYATLVGFKPRYSQVSKVQALSSWLLIFQAKIKKHKIWTVKLKLNSSEIFER